MSGTPTLTHPTGQPAPAPAGQEPVIGYVLKMYPRFSETFIVSEILAREAAGERIVIFSLRPTTDARFHAELAKVQAPVVHVPRTSTAGRFWQQLQGAARHPELKAGISRAFPELLDHEHDDAFQAIMLAQLATEHGITHLHAHFASVATTVARLAGVIARLPYSFTAHAKDIFHDDVDQRALGVKLAEAHHAVTISEYNLRHMRARFGPATERLHLVRNGLQLPRFPYDPQRSEPADGIPRLLGVGRLVEKKGFHLLVSAVAQLRAAGIEVHADIVGDGPEAPQLRAQIASLGLSQSITLLGPRTQAEVNELLGDHDLFIAPFVVGADGNADGLPTVLLEAMARGIPCVAADVTAVGEVIRGTQSGPETGWLVPTEDLAALTEAIRQAVYTDGVTRRRITDAARELISENFDSTRQAAQLRSLVSGTASSCPERYDAAARVPARAEVLQ